MMCANDVLCSSEAVECYLQAAEIYTDMVYIQFLDTTITVALLSLPPLSPLCLLSVQGRFTMAARYHNNIAEICESELADFEQVNV